jgi:hypothetical protein
MRDLNDQQDVVQARMRVDVATSSPLQHTTSGWGQPRPPP